MNRLCLILFLFIVSLNGWSEPSVLLMKINGKPISVADYLFYAQAVRSFPDRELFNRFVEFKLTVEYAKELMLDTTADFRRAEELILRKCLTNYLIRTYGIAEDPDKVNSPSIIQLLKPIPQQFDNRSEEETISLFAHLYEELGKGFPDYYPEPGFIQGHAIQVDTFYYDGYENFFIEEVTEVIRSLNEKEISRPFRTALGWHILIRRENTATYSLIEQRSSWYPILEELKGKHNFQQNLPLPEQSGKKGILFSLGHRNYTIDEFEQFVLRRIGGIQKLYEEFIHKSVLDYEKEFVLLYDTGFVRKYNFEMESLLYEMVAVQNEKTWNKVDQQTFFNYYRNKKRKEQLQEVIFEGAVVHTVTRSLFKHIKRRMKKLPATQWKKAIEEEFNREGIKVVEIEQGEFRRGDNPFVDNRIFKLEDAVAFKNFSYTQVVGKKKKYTGSYLEGIPESVEKEYMKFLKSEWNTQLMDKFGLEIDEEVLKTVNNL